MSDEISDDDFDNNYGPTTPAPPKKARQRAGSGKPVAGPSTKPASKTTAAKKPANRAVSVIELGDDDEDVAVVEPSRKRKATEEEGEAAAQPKGVTKKAPTVPVSNANGVTKAAAGKGKAKANPPAKVNGSSGDAMDIDKDNAIAAAEDEPSEPPAPRAARGITKPLKAKNGITPAAAARHAKTEERMAREIEHLRAQLERSRESATEVAAQRDKLAAQLEDVFHIRNTEPERSLSEYKAHFEESMKRKESLIQELTERLAKLQSPSKSEQSYTLHFLTREAADEEQRALQNEISRLKEAIKERDAVVRGKDQQITSLRDEIATVKKDLDLEIQRSKSLAARAPGSAAAGPSRPTPLEVKNAPVIRLYEDMTNVLVTSVKYERSPEWPELEEESISCVYTHNSGDQTFSLNFVLRNSYSRPDDYPPDKPLAKEQLVMKVKYMPRDLEHESSEIVEGLGFFKEPFMFAKEQMTVFLKSLTDAITSLFDDGDDDDNDDGQERGNQTEIIMVE